MSIARDVLAAGDAVAAEFTDELRSQATIFGLPKNLAQTAYLEWDGYTFVAKSTDPRMFDAEYGDGNTPPRAPIRKALNRLRPRLTDAMQQRVDAVAVPEART